MSSVARRDPGIGGAPVWAVAGFVIFAAAAVVLLASSFMLGPAILVVGVVPAVAAALAFIPFIRRGQAAHAVAVAEMAGAVEPITIWGVVTETSGVCPSGNTPAKGFEFAVSKGDVWPHMCPHARAAILAKAAEMERGECLPDCPIWYHDAAHSFRIELHKEGRPVYVQVPHAA